VGYHSGILAANASWVALERALRLRLGTRAGEPIAVDDLDRDGCAGGELDGRAYILDGEMLLSTDGDLVLELSRELGCLVIGCGAETVSGSFWLFAADRGARLRTYWSCAMELDAALDTGDWARAVPLEDLGGIGIRDALSHGGFDFEGWLDHGTHISLSLPESYAGGSGVIASEIDAFRGAHRLPPDRAPKPQLVFHPPVVARESLWGRVRRWFA